jgi:TP901 family phage tail tape measure protein
MPILLAAGAATKFALDQERAMTRVKKVYGEAGMSTTVLKNELGALEKAFVALSNKYGVTIEETGNIAAEWAAAGASGLALAKNVDLTMKTMVLGELEAADATKALIAIQAQYRFDADQLTDTMARLNAIENATGTTTGDLIDAMSRSAGVARQAGIEVEQLGGMIAALTPAAGSASQAGNALKTIISRILAPTKDAADLMDLMGLKTSEVAWQSMDATSRIELLASRYFDLSDAQQAVVSKYVATTYQINKFGVLLEAVNEEQSYYNTALKVAGDRADYFARAERELNAVLDSNPQKVKQAGVILQNSMIKIIQPFLPMIVGLAQTIADLGNKFQELSSPVQKLIVIGFLALAMVGPLVRYFGSLATLISVLTRSFTIFLAPLYGAVAGIASLVGTLATFTVSTMLSGLGLLATGFGWVAAAAGTAVWSMTRALLITALLGPATVLAGTLYATLWAGLIGTSRTGGGLVVKITSAAMAGLSAVFAAIRPVIIAVWSAMHLGLFTVMLAWRVYITTAWSVMMQSLLAITAAFGGAVSLLWNAIPLTMAAGLKGPFAIIYALWSAFLVGLLGIKHAFWVQAEFLTYAGGLLIKGATMAWQGAVTALTAGWAVVQTAILARLGPTMAMIWRATGISLLVITAIWQNAIVKSFALFQAGLLAASVAYMQAMSAVWSAIAMSWAIGLRTPYALMLAVTSAFMGQWRNIWLAGTMLIQGIIVGFAYIAGALWQTLQITLATISIAGSATLAFIYSKLGTTLRMIWLATSIGITAIVTTWGSILPKAFALIYQAIVGLTVAFGAFMRGIWATMALSWAVGLRGPYSLMLAMTAGVMTGIGGLMAAAWTAIQKIIVAGAYIAGAIWRTMLISMHTATVIFTIVVPVLMRGMFSALIALFSVGGKALIFLFTRALGLAAMTGVKLFFGILPALTAIWPMLIAVITSPWTIAVAAVIATIIYFWDEIKAIFQHIVDRMNWASEGIVSAFNALPEGIRNAFTRVIAFVRAAAQQIQEWLSYLNPFARHSPSLVDNVTAGMAVIRQQYGTLTQIAGPINAAYAGIQRLRDVSASLREGAATMKLAAQIKELAEVAPQVVPAFRDLGNQLTVLQNKADALQAVITRQESTVRVWKEALDVASEALDAQRDKLDSLKKVADDYRDRIDELKGAIQDLASTPITGMGAMADAIFENEMAQKRLRLEIMDLEDAGQSYDDLKSKMAGLAGEIEMLRGAQADLRSKGAGSEILGFYDQQIAALEAQQEATEQQVGPLNEAKSALEALERQAERMDLTQSLQFDPLTRQIEQAANSMKEMPFSQILSQIQQNQAALGPLETAWNQANNAVTRQQAAVDQAQAAHDRIQASYDVENDKLQVLKDTYGQVSSAISDVNSALSDMQAAAEAANGAASDSMSPALTAFHAGEGAADFADVGGNATIGREGGLEDQSALIDQWTKDVEDDLANSFGGIDMWQPFRDMWNGLVKWWDANVGPWITGIKNFFGRMFFNVDIFGPIGDKFAEWDIGGMFTDAWDKISAVIRTVWDFATILWDLFGPTLMDTLGTVGKFFTDLWDAISVVWDEASVLLDPFIQALKNLWNIAEPFVAFFIGRFLFGLELLWSVINGALGPVLDWLVGLFKNIWQAVKGVIEIFIGLFTLDAGKFFGGLYDLVAGLWGIVWDTLVSIGKTILGAIGGLAKGLWDGMVWVADQLFGGLGSGIEAGIVAVWDWIVGIGQTIWDAITDFLGISSPSTLFASIGGFLMEGLGAGISAGIDFVISIFKGFFSIVSGIFSVLGAIFSWLWTNIIMPIVGFIIDYIKAWAAIISWLWTNVVSPIFKFIGALLSWLWTNVIMPIVDFIILYIKAWIAIITWLWTNVISPIFAFIGAIFEWLWNNIIKPIIDFIILYIEAWIAIITWLWDNVVSPIFSLIGAAFEVLGAIFAWVWDNVIAPMFEALWTIIKWIWENVLKPIFDAIGWAFGALGTAFEWVWDNVLKPVFDAIGSVFKWIWENVLKPAFDAVDIAFEALGDAMEWVWENILKPVFDTFGEIVEGLQSVFETVVSAIETAWDGLKEIAAKPINFVIETVLNNGLIKAFNAVVGFFGLDSWKIDKLTPVSFARGGPVRGYSATDTADNIPAWLTAKEFVQPVRAVQRYGTGFMEDVRSGRFPVALARGYADGGTVDQLYALILREFPRANLNSGRRNTSDYHGRGMAADLGERGFAGGMGRPYLAQMAAFIYNAFRNATELIYTGAGDVTPDLKNGRPLNYGAATNAAHRNHVHWAMTPEALLGAQGSEGMGAFDGRSASGSEWSWWDLFTDPIGTIENAFDSLLSDIGGGKLGDYVAETPGRIFDGIKDWITDMVDFDTGGVVGSGGVARNRSGSPERVLSPRQTESFDRLITFLDSNRISGGGTLEGAIFKATEKAHRAESIGGQVIVNGDLGTTNITNNFYGDLSFPNITDGDDADEFLRNLTDLAGGHR